MRAEAVAGAGWLAYHAGAMSASPRPPSPALACLLVAILAALVLVACSEPQPPTVSLYRAIDHGDLDQLKRHLHWGADINQPDASGDFPLHVAVRRGREVIVRELLRHGARLDVEDGSGRTPVFVALAEGRTQPAQVLLAADPSQDPQALLLALVEAGVADRDSLGLLLRRGARLDALGEGGSAALHIAVERGGLPLIRRLIEAGADVNQPDGQGRTALAIAEARGDRDIIALLRRFGAAATVSGE